MVRTSRGRRAAPRRAVAGRPVARRAVALVQAMVGVMVMGAFASLSVDFGAVLLTRCELQRAADAAAMAGVADLREGGTATTAVAQARLMAKSNGIGGAVLDDAAIEAVAGAWQGGAFVPGATPTRAVRVRLRRSAATGNPVPLYFGKMIGMTTADAAATSVVRLRTAGPDYKLVGIDRASFGSVNVLAKVNGRLVSNGDVSVGRPLGVLVSVTDARSYAGQTKVGMFAAVTGSTARLDEALEYESVRLPKTNNNEQISGYLDCMNDFIAVGAADIPPGTYVVRDLNLLAGVAVRLRGPVTFYVTRAVNIAAGVNLLGDNDFPAKNFKVRVLPGATVAFVGNVLTPLVMDLYAPDSDILIAVTVNAFRGRLVGKTLTVLLPAAGTFTEDTTLGDALSGDEALAIVR